jgi:ComF family protein
MFKKLFLLFFPELCAGCGNILIYNENLICITCRHKLPLTNDSLVDQNQGFKKFYGRIPVEHVSSMLYYHKKGIVQQLIYNLKYKNHQAIGRVLGDWYVEELKGVEKLQSIDFIVPVPLHKKRFKARGYNQVDSFCQAIASGLNKEYDPKILFREVYALTQSKKNLIDRNAVLQNTFQVKFSSMHHNKHFLLIDDVLTTGATLEACANAILKIPDAKISMVTIAISQG